MPLEERSFAVKSGTERRLRDALGRFATGVTVVTTRSPGGKLEGVTANSFSAVSLDPPLVLWSLRRNAPSLLGFLESRHFAVNVLAVEQSHVSRQFAQPRNDKFEGIAHAPGLGGCALIEGALAMFECAVEKTIEGGDHVIFVGRVDRATYRDGSPLVFNAGRYCAISPIVEDESMNRLRRQGAT